MSIYHELVECFTQYDPETFRNIHHEEFMMVREAELSTLDEHCEIIDELASKPTWDWHIKADLIHENDYCMETRWIDCDEVVTNINLKKDAKLWRAIISRTSRKKVV